MKQLIFSFALAIICLKSSIECANYLPTLLNKIDVEKPGFVVLIPNDVKTKYHMAISSFNGAPFSSDYVYFIANYSSSSTNLIKQLDNTKLVWPNEVSYMNESIIDLSFDPFGGVIAPGGFLVPSKTVFKRIYVLTFLFS
jgi:hypothetical protein